MVIELVELYNFASMTFDLEGQGQGQIGKKSIFWEKWRHLAGKMLLLLQFLMQSHKILHDGRPLVDAKKLWVEILIWGPLAADWIFEDTPPDRSESIFQKF